MGSVAEVEFRVVTDFPNYRVGNDGSVWGRHDRGGNPLPDGEWRRLKPICAGQYLYHYVQLTRQDQYQKVVKREYVHALVLRLFVGPRPFGMEARHLDGDRYNNRHDNLCWGTAKENSADKIRHGSSGIGEENAMATITNSQAIEVAKLRLSGMSIGEASCLSGFPKHQISKIWRGETWSKVTGVSNCPAGHER